MWMQYILGLSAGLTDTKTKLENFVQNWNFDKTS